MPKILLWRSMYPADRITTVRPGFVNALKMYDNAIDRFFDALKKKMEEYELTKKEAIELGVDYSNEPNKFGFITSAEVNDGDTLYHETITANKELKAVPFIKVIKVLYTKPVKNPNYPGDRYIMVQY